MINTSLIKNMFDNMLQVQYYLHQLGYYTIITYIFVIHSH